MLYPYASPTAGFLYQDRHILIYLCQGTLHCEASPFFCSYFYDDVAPIADVRFVKIGVFHGDPRIKKALSQCFSVACENTLLLQSGIYVQKNSQVIKRSKLRVATVRPFGDAQSFRTDRDRFAQSKSLTVKTAILQGLSV